MKISLLPTMAILGSALSFQSASRHDRCPEFQRQLLSSNFSPNCLSKMVKMSAATGMSNLSIGRMPSGNVGLCRRMPVCQSGPQPGETRRRVPRASWRTLTLKCVAVHKRFGHPVGKNFLLVLTQQVSARLSPPPSHIQTTSSSRGGMPI